MQPNNEQNPGGNWSFRNEDDAVGQSEAGSPSEPSRNIEPVTWTASEFIAHQRTPGWYLSLIGGFVGLSIIIYLLTKDLISVVAIMIVAILFLIASTKRPEQLPYQVDEHGISIGKRFYPYDLFKSFAMRQEGAIGSITFMPLKRLMPEISIYYAPDDEARIVDVLAGSLPNDQRKEHSADRLLKHLRF